MSGSDASALGKYRLVAELGRGGMADVYLALVSGPGGFNKLVVIKRIRASLAEDPDFLAMFMDEARLAARLNHPNVIQTYEVGGEGRQPFIAMEYLEGQPLHRALNRLGRDGDLTLPAHLRVLIDALTGLHYAHELRDFDGKSLDVVHRDVTPHNVFVTYSGQVKVMDFGVAKAAGASAETRAGVLKGTVSYMAPEQALGEPIDRRADIFSVGVMIWEALTRKRLFREENDLACLQKIVTGQIPDPRSVSPDAPEGLSAICMKALSQDREARHATAADLAADLERALGAMGERPDLRELGRILAGHFTEEQERITALVEAEANALKAEDDASSDRSTARLDTGPLKLPVLDAPVSEASIPVDFSSRPRVNARATGGAAADRPPMSDHPAPTTRRSLSHERPVSFATPSRWGLWIGGIALTAGIGALLLWIYPGRGGAPIAPSAAPSGTTAHMIHIESTPPGATVSEGGTPLGTTPLALALDPAQVEARRFVVSLPGYTPYTIQQGPTREDLRVMVPLSRVESASMPSAAAGGIDAAAPTHIRAPASAPKPVPTPLPINTSR